MHIRSNEPNQDRALQVPWHAGLVLFASKTCGPKRVAALVERGRVAGVVDRGARILEADPVIRCGTAASQRAIVVNEDFASANVTVALAHVTNAEDKRRQHDELPARVQQHVTHHRLRQDRLHNHTELHDTLTTGVAYFSTSYHKKRLQDLNEAAERGVQRFEWVSRARGSKI